jgi:hypothetical protein
MMEVIFTLPEESTQMVYLFDVAFGKFPYGVSESPCMWLKPQVDRFKPVQTGYSFNRIHSVWA